MEAKVEEKEEEPNPLLAWLVEEEPNLVVMEKEESRGEEYQPVRPRGEA